MKFGEIRVLFYRVLDWRIQAGLGIVAEEVLELLIPSADMPDLGYAANLTGTGNADGSYKVFRRNFDPVSPSAILIVVKQL